MSLHHPAPSRRILRPCSDHVGSQEANRVPSRKSYGTLLFPIHSTKEIQEVAGCVTSRSLQIRPRHIQNIIITSRGVSSQPRLPVVLLSEKTETTCAPAASPESPSPPAPPPARCLGCARRRACCSCARKRRRCISTASSAPSGRYSSRAETSRRTRCVVLLANTMQGFGSEGKTYHWTMYPSPR